MQKNSTSRSMAMRVFLLTSFVMLVSIMSEPVIAQSFCANESPLFIENFGAGTTPETNPSIIAGALTYQEAGSLGIDGVYRVINNSQQNPAWHASPDHTGNTDGKMLVINGKGNTFYSHVVTSPTGFQAGYYAVSMYFMNVNRVENCQPGVSPILSFVLEYQAQDNSWVALGGSTVTVPLLGSPTWAKLGSVFTLPSTGAFNIQSIRVSINDGTMPICGNDFAIDDIKLAVCVDGGPLPVEFSNISARQKGTGITVDWSTASETNSKYFDVEKSIDGGKRWSHISTTNAAGNSTLTKKYSAIDPKQVAGINYYRIKQVDLDGKFKYSQLVKVKVNTEKTVASVISNPFISNLGIDFLSKSNQQVYLTLFDVTGKIIAFDKMSLPVGSSRQTFNNLNKIQQGIYVLKIVDENGGYIYKGKLVKQ